MVLSAPKAALIAGLCLVAAACGQGGAQSAAIKIDRAEWRGDNVRASGNWARGVSTPPTCRLLEAPDGPESRSFETEARVSLDGNTFSKEFVPVPIKKSGADPTKVRRDYFVRCTVSLDSGRSAEDTRKVKDTP
ncbi:hypothetical protein BH23ACT11_BH23ACT11_11070 [soil metagenome]